jgi:RND family efflux transporter MFP subunit
MNRSALAALALAVSLPLALLAGCGGSEARESHVPDAAGERSLSAPVARAERLEVPRTLELYGTVEADRTASVSSRVTAQVTAVHAAAGDSVRRGQVLLEIDPQAARGQVAQARGALAQASAALALTERNYERYRALAESDSASELELDMARMEYERSRGAVEQAEGALAAASSVAADSRVTAPFDGRVVRRMVEVGDMAAPGRPLLSLESGTVRRAALRVPESAVAAGALEIGSPVEVRIDARPDLGVLTGRVVEMSPGSDPMAHAYDVKVELPEADAPPATGFAVRAAVPVGSREAVAVPAAAVLSRGGLELVVTVGEEGGTASRAVTVGATLPDGRVEILSGLQGGERVALGLARVPPAGTTVRPADPMEEE